MSLRLPDVAATSIIKGIEMGAHAYHRAMKQDLKHARNVSKSSKLRWRKSDGTLG